MDPAISVISIVQHGKQRQSRIIQALERQTIKNKMELIIVGDTDESVKVDNQLLAVFHSVRKIILGPYNSTAMARARGIRIAKAPVIAFTEDHCYPAPDWAGQLLRHFGDGYTGVGPSFANANPRNSTSWANFLIEYGHFAVPVSGRFPGQIPGHNSAYRRDPLVKFGDRLEDILEVEAVMQWELMRSGHRFTVSPHAVTYHLNFSRFWNSFIFRFHGGRLFAFHRAKGWPPGKRLVYFCASPLIPWVRLIRVTRAAFRIGQKARIPKMLSIAFILLVFDGIGEMAGYIGSIGKSMAYLSDREMDRDRYLTAGDREMLKNFNVFLDELFQEP